MSILEKFWGGKKEETPLPPKTEVGEAREQIEEINKDLAQKTAGTEIEWTPENEAKVTGQDVEEVKKARKKVERLVEEAVAQQNKPLEERLEEKIKKEE